jgi:hypothetical protein
MAIQIAFFRGLFIWFALVSTAQAQVDPGFFYFYKGDTPGGWRWVLGDPTNWWLALDGNQGVSASGKLTLEPSSSTEFPGAVRLIWGGEKKNYAGLNIGEGGTLDFSPYEHTHELVLAVMVEEFLKKKKHVVIKLKCGNNCRGEVSIRDHLKAAELNKWFLLPIPLDCFVKTKGEGVTNFDLKKIDSPFEIGTEGEIILHIAEVSLQKMAPGDEGSKPNPAPGG